MGSAPLPIPGTFLPWPTPPPPIRHPINFLNREVPPIALLSHSDDTLSLACSSQVGCCSRMQLLEFPSGPKRARVDGPIFLPRRPRTSFSCPVPSSSTTPPRLFRRLQPSIRPESLQPGHSQFVNPSSLSAVCSPMAAFIQSTSSKTVNPAASLQAPIGFPLDCGFEVCTWPPVSLVGPGSSPVRTAWLEHNRHSPLPGTDQGISNLISLRNGQRAPSLGNELVVLHGVWVAHPIPPSMSCALQIQTATMA